VAPYEVGEAREALVFLTDQSEAVAYQELRSQFVANVSHELRTPLTGLRGLLEALDDPAMDPATRADFVARATSETQRLEALITDILFLSELETAPGRPSGSRSDLAQTASATVADLRRVAEDHGVRLELDIDGPAWTPLSDRMAATIVRNLVENAVKYTPPGGHVAVNARAGEDGSAVLEVEDDGPGIPAEHLPRIFERFYRVDKARSREMGGTGLGLSIVKHLAEGMGAAVSVASEPGRGTRFTVRIPSRPTSIPAERGGEEDGESMGEWRRS
jgi:two-component system phosphate regulon sensor histidine kinase PhoR